MSDITVCPFLDCGERLTFRATCLAIGRLPPYGIAWSRWRELREGKAPSYGEMILIRTALTLSFARCP